jgi:hypothetical protein
LILIDFGEAQKSLTADEVAIWTALCLTSSVVLGTVAGTGRLGMIAGQSYSIRAPPAEAG